MSEIYPLADKFDLSPRLKQNGEGKTGRLKWSCLLTMSLFTAKMHIFSHVAGVTIFSKQPSRQVIK